MSLLPTCCRRHAVYLKGVSVLPRWNVMILSLSSQAYSMFLLLLPLPAEQLIAHFHAFKCKRIQHQAGFFSTFCFIAHNCRKGLLKSEIGPSLHKILTPGLDLGPEENYKILPESTPSLWIHGNLYHLTCTAITLYTQSKKLLLTVMQCSLSTISSFALGRSAV